MIGLSEYGSTEFILRHNYALNKRTVDNYSDLLGATSKPQLSEVKSVPDPVHPLREWLNVHTYQEWRVLDCLHSKEFIDPDPIPELLPEHQLKYMAIVFDPDASLAFTGLNDPVSLQSLYKSKYGPGTPQALLCETPIIGWVMYYEFEDFVLIAEIQANNTLRGGILNYASLRRHFYRHLLSTFASYWDRPIVCLTKSEQAALHQVERAGRSTIPTSPYHKDILSWCGFQRSTISTAALDITNKGSVVFITNDTNIWIL